MPTLPPEKDHPCKRETRLGRSQRERGGGRRADAPHVEEDLVAEALSRVKLKVVDGPAALGLGQVLEEGVVALVGRRLEDDNLGVVGRHAVDDVLGLLAGLELLERRQALLGDLDSGRLSGGRVGGARGDADAGRRIARGRPEREGRKQRVGQGQGGGSSANRPLVTSRPSDDLDNQQPATSDITTRDAP